MKYLRKLLKTLNYLLVKLELKYQNYVSFQENRRKTLRKFCKNYAFPKKIVESLRKFLENFTFKFGESL